MNILVKTDPSSRTRRTKLVDTSRMAEIYADNVATNTATFEEISPYAAGIQRYAYAGPFWYSSTFKPG